MKPQARLDGRYVTKEETASASNVPVFVLKEENTFIYYSPVFDLSGYGYTDEEAKKSLIIALNEFFRYTINKKTFENELLKLGWRGVKKKQFIPPSMSELIKERDYLAEIMDKHDFTKSSLAIEIPEA